MGSIYDVLGALRPVFDVAFGSMGPMVSTLLSSIDWSKVGDL